MRLGRARGCGLAVVHAGRRRVRRRWCRPDSGGARDGGCAKSTGGQVASTAGGKRVDGGSWEESVVVAVEDE